MRDDGARTIDRASVPAAARRRRHARGWRLITALLLLVPLFHVLGLLWLIWSQSFDVPINDEWSLLNVVQAYDDGTMGFDTFWQYQAIHRIVVTRAIGFPLIQLTDWNRQVMMTVSLVGTVATLAFLVAAARRTTGWSWVVGPMSAGLSLIFLSFAHGRVWLQPFLIAFIVAALGAAMSTWGLAQPPTRRWPFAVAIAGGVLTTLSFLAGLFAWLAFLPAVWHHGRRRLAIWIGSALALCVPYLFGFPRQAAQDANPASIIDIPRDALVYGMGYLGSPFTGEGPRPAQLFGTVGAVLLVGNALVAVRRRGGWASIAPWIGLTAFVAMTAGLTFLGRGARSPQQPLAGRYVPIQTLWWAAVVVVALVAIQAAWSRRQASSSAAETSSGSGRRFGPALLGINSFAAATLIVGAVVHDRRGYDVVSDWLAQGRLNTPCARHFEQATDDCLDFYTIPRAFSEYGPYLREHRLAQFRDDWPSDPPPPSASDLDGMGAISAVNDSRVTPQRRRPIVVAEGEPVTILGWALDPATSGIAGGVEIVVDDGPPLMALYGERLRRLNSDPATDGRPVGFLATAPQDALTPGQHTVRARVLDPSRTTFSDLPGEVQVIVTPDGTAPATPPTGSPPNAAATPVAPPVATPTTGITRDPQPETQRPARGTRRPQRERRASPIAGRGGPDAEERAERRRERRAERTPAAAGP